ncbi:MAG: hypothetical protein RMM17_01055 [Acidobacteriota bacterium]|nr:hypothetical protein [Blastocatellia bacterium]MDW8411256.1 hypothetical protein [Acidobacteriota bacterium]
MRLILLDVQLKPVDDGKDSPKEAYVVLSLKGQRIVGHHVQTNQEDELAVIASATLRAVQNALPVPVKLSLRNAIKLTPQFLDSPLLVVIAELHYGKSRFELTGACQCDESAMRRGIAQAALDATNRLVSFIFSEQHR